jgi:hypothetical protein
VSNATVRPSRASKADTPGVICVEDKAVNRDILVHRFETHKVQLGGWRVTSIKLKLGAVPYVMLYLRDEAKTVLCVSEETEWIFLNAQVGSQTQVETKLQGHTQKH